MLRKRNSDTLNLIIILSIVVLLIDFLFFNNGIIVSLLFAGVFLYYGWKRINKFKGKLLFGIGIGIFLISILSTFILRLFVVIFAIYVLLEYFQNKRNPEIISPTIKSSNGTGADDGPIIRKPFVGTHLFGSKSRSDMPFEWDDINIVRGFGDSFFDLSNTVLPKGESIIMIRNIAGNVEIWVPYDVEVKIAHTAFIGKATFFDSAAVDVRNSQLVYESPLYQEATYKIRVVTSLCLGSLEVKRI